MQGALEKSGTGKGDTGQEAEVESVWTYDWTYSAH